MYPKQVSTFDFIDIFRPLAYKIAKRYGLIVENDIDVKFHFETVCSNDS